MDGLLDSLLLITRIEGTMSLDKQDEDVVKSLKTVLKQLATEFDDKNIDRRSCLSITKHLGKWISVII